jgi:hypothetical protein
MNLLHIMYYVERTAGHFQNMNRYIAADRQANEINLQTQTCIIHKQLYISYQCMSAVLSTHLCL